MKHDKSFKSFLNFTQQNNFTPHRLKCSQYDPQHVSENNQNGCIDIDFPNFKFYPTHEAINEMVLYEKFLRY